MNTLSKEVSKAIVNYVRNNSFDVLTDIVAFITNDKESLLKSALIKNVLILMEIKCIFY